MGDGKIAGGRISGGLAGGRRTGRRLTVNHSAHPELVEGWRPVSSRLTGQRPAGGPKAGFSKNQRHSYHFIRLISSTLTVARWRYIRRIIASAKPTSAAAMVMMKIAKICPSKLANRP